MRKWNKTFPYTDSALGGCFREGVAFQSCSTQRALRHAVVFWLFLSNVFNVERRQGLVVLVVVRCFGWRGEVGCY